MSYIELCGLFVFVFLRLYLGNISTQQEKSSCLHLVLAMVDQPLGSPQHRVVRPNQLSQVHLHVTLKNLKSDLLYQHLHFALKKPQIKQDLQQYWRSRCQEVP